MARKPQNQLALDFDGQPEAPPESLPFVSETVYEASPRDYPPWDPRYVRWFNGLSEYGRVLEQIRLDKIVLQSDTHSWMKEFFESRIKRNQAWLDRENNVPF
jgi:hypothetical protein